MFDIKNHDILSHKTVKASEMCTGQLFLFNNDPVSTDYIKMAVCGFDSRDDYDVKYIYPFASSEVVGASDLEYIDEHRPVLLVKATVSEITLEKS
ncbi:hypothetical protein [Vibrio phage vB_VpaP_SJSY21]|nr:hypothetical protein [Vibrio phage vB_VpaP_SJSY21]